MLTTYRRGRRRVYPMILLSRRASLTTWYVGHRTTRMNRRLGGLSTWGGFGRLGRTSLLFVGRVSRIGLAHKGDHIRAHFEIVPNMPGRWRKCRRCYVMSKRRVTSWSSVCDNSRPSCPLWEYHMHALVLSSLHLQTKVVRRLLVVNL
jgi:hypothetical protein